MRELSVDVILRNGDDLVRAQEHWIEYSIDGLRDDFGFAQAHSVNGNDAEDDKVWVLIAKHPADGFEVTNLTLEDYLRWQENSNAEREKALEEYAAKAESDLADHLDLQAERVKRAKKALKSLGIDIEDLRALLFAHSTGA